LLAGPLLAGYLELGNAHDAFFACELALLARGRVSVGIVSNLLEQALVIFVLLLKLIVKGLT
jgi:hypothetical protein